jgi:hypothetical protein
MLYHHLVGHTASYDYREQRSQSHTHLQYPPKWTLGACECGITKELVGLEYHIVNLLFEDIDTEIGKDA